jgi:hypothetical protein
VDFDREPTAMRRWALTALVLLPLPAAGAPRTGPARDAAVAPADTLATACRAAERRQFDFWVGRWTVTDTAGRVVGHSEVTRVAGGCGILEHWMGRRGVGGRSLNGYDPTTRRWSQFWVGEGGLVLHLSGELSGASMVLSGRRTGRHGELLDRITWTPLDNGDVRQLWEVSADGGSTWKIAFDGHYSPS